MPLSTEYDQTLQAFSALWESKNLPIEARRYVVGAVYQAGVKQGDEIFPREIFKAVLWGKPLLPDDELMIYEKVHKFVLVDKKLRAQYLTICLHLLLRHLDAYYGPGLKEKLKREARLN